MLTKRQLDHYLKRIDVLSTCSVTKQELLHSLHYNHLTHIPFENLDIALGREIRLEEESLFNKVISQSRGGFCYELNFCFYLLLSTLGFNVQLISGRVFDGENFGEEFDHLLLLVESEGDRFIADVGFGDSFTVPVNINGQESKERYASYRVVRKGEDYLLQKKGDAALWVPQYRFNLIPRTLKAFKKMSQYHQTSANSPFTQKSTSTIVTEHGRVTLSNQTLITTINNIKTKQPVVEASQYYHYLESYFNIALDDEGFLFNQVRCD